MENVNANMRGNPHCCQRTSNVFPVSAAEQVRLTSVRFRTVLFWVLRRVCGSRLDFPQELQATPSCFLSCPFYCTLYTFTVFHRANDMYSHHLDVRNKHLRMH
jgi:hypothetical protein